MNIEIQARGFELTPTVAEHVERRVRFGMTRYEPKIGTLEVDLNRFVAPGRVTCVRVVIRAEMASCANVEVEDVELGLEHAVERAVARAARAVRQRLYAHVTARRVG